VEAGFEKKVRHGVWGWKFSVGSSGKSPVGELDDKVPRRLVIFSILHYNDVIS